MTFGLKAYLSLMDAAEYGLQPVVMNSYTYAFGLFLFLFMK